MSDAAQKELAATREAIAALHAERGDLQRQHVSRDEALQALDRWIAKRAAECDPSIGNLLRGEGVLDLAALDAGGRRDLEPALCALVPDAIRQVVGERIDAALADQPSIGSEDRQRRLDDIAAELLRLERDEEDLVQHLEADGVPTARRADADPRAVLGLDEPPPRPAPPPRTYQIDKTPRRKSAAR